MPPSDAALIERVRRQAPGSALDRVEAALALGQALASAADELIGHFVDEARRDGRSWTEIGGRMGVSKQAARQRFASGLHAARRRRGRRERHRKTDDLVCSFCGKRRDEGRRLVVGPAVRICEECVRLCDDILSGSAGR